MAIRAPDPYPFTPEFQRAIARQLLADPALLPRLAPYLHAERFEDEAVRLVAESVLRVYNELGIVPTPVVVLQEVRGKVESGALTLDKVAECAAVFELAEEAPPAASTYVQEQVFAEERKAAIWTALDDGMRLHRQGKFDDVVRAMSRADSIGKVDVSMGTDLGVSIGERTDFRKSGKVPPRWGTGITDLDDVLSGGLGNGELGCLLGAPKGGKTQGLAFFGLHCAGQGGTVVHISLEMSEAEMANRYDAAVSRVPINDLVRRADIARDLINSWFDTTGGAVIIKYMAPGATARDIDAYLQHLRAERNVHPTMLIVDSGDHMRSISREYEKRHEELGIVYRELRDLTVKYDVPGWTASWANKEALAQKIVTMANTADSFRKVAVCDVQVAICRTEEERMDKLIRFFVAASRFSTDGVVVGPYPTAFDVGRIVADGQAKVLSDE